MDIPEVLIPLFGILMGGIVALVPLVGLTARFGLRPLIESWNRGRSAAGAEPVVQMLERRVALLEQQVETLERDNQRLLEAEEFKYKLQTGG